MMVEPPARRAQLAEDQPAGAWLREQAQEFGALALDYAKAQLRKTHAEARSREIGNIIQELRPSLGMTKALLIGEEGDEAILLGLQVEEMLVALKVVGGGEAKAGSG